MNQIKLSFNMIGFMEIFKIYHEEQQLPVKYCDQKVFNIAKNPKYPRYQYGSASMVYYLLD